LTWFSGRYLVCTLYPAGRRACCEFTVPPHRISRDAALCGCDFSCCICTGWHS